MTSTHDLLVDAIAETLARKDRQLPGVDSRAKDVAKAVEERFIVYERVEPEPEPWLE